MTIKVPLSAQISEAERWVEAGKKAAETNPNVAPRVNITEAIVLTLQTYDALLQAGYVR